MAYLKTDGISLIMGFSSAEFEGLLKTVLPGMGLNWRKYLRRNIRRRLLHRLDALGLASLEKYREVLHSEEKEFQIFYNLLTVTISRFFPKDGICKRR